MLLRSAKSRNFHLKNFKNLVHHLDFLQRRCFKVLNTKKQENELEQHLKLAGKASFEFPDPDRFYADP